MKTILPDRETSVVPLTHLAAPDSLGGMGTLPEVPDWVPLLLAGDLDDDGTEPHICRGID